MDAKGDATCAGGDAPCWDEAEEVGAADAEKSAAGAGDEPAAGPAWDEAWSVPAGRAGRGGCAAVGVGAVGAAKGEAKAAGAGAGAGLGAESALSPEEDAAVGAAGPWVAGSEVRARGATAGDEAVEEDREEGWPVTMPKAEDASGMRRSEEPASPGLGPDLNAGAREATGAEERRQRDTRERATATGSARPDARADRAARREGAAPGGDAGATAGAAPAAAGAGRT